MKWLPIACLCFLVSAPAAWPAETVSGPKSVQLTVYSGGFALVKDSRSVSLKQGIDSIEVADVAAQIEPASILFKSITLPNSVVILEQNYQYDLINPDNILSKSVGQRVTFTSFDSVGTAHTQHGVTLNGGPAERPSQYQSKFLVAGCAIEPRRAGRPGGKNG